MKFGEKIKVSLDNNEWTQAYFAELMHVHPATVQKWVGGKNTPAIETAKEIGKILNIPIHELLDDSLDIYKFYVIDRYIPYDDDRYPDNFKDGEHTIVDAGLKGNAILHRFVNAAGCPYSAIYYAKREIWSQIRDRERFMIRAWNEWGYKSFI